MSAFMPQLRLRTQPGPRKQPAGLRPWVLICLLWLAVVQVCVPTLGAMHQVVHQSDRMGPAAAQRWAPQPLATHATAPSTQLDDFSARLFDGHSSADCQLFDQMTSGAGLLPSVASLPLVSLPVHHVPWSVQALLLRKSPALFFARGPPLALRA